MCGVSDNQMKTIRMPHTNHENHLCYLQNVGWVQNSLEGYKEPVRDGTYLCRACGRMATEEENVCLPGKL